MTHLYDIDNFFLYKEKISIFSYGNLGAYKINLPCIINLIFFLLYSLISVKKKLGVGFVGNFWKSVNSFFRFLSTITTAINTGYQLKFGPRGKRTRIYYNSFLFFLKLGYSSRISFLLPLDLSSNAKTKKERFFSVKGLNYNSLSNTIFQISSFRSIDPYNFGGIMLRDGYFKYNNWSSKLL